MGTMDMDSVPPATMTSAEPARMRSAAKGNGLQAGRAESGLMVIALVFDGKSGAERGDARDVHALFAFGHGAAEDHVVYVLGVEGRGTRASRFLDSQGRRDRRGRVGAQGTLIGAAYGSAGRRENDDGFWHGGTLARESLGP